MRESSTPSAKTEKTSFSCASYKKNVVRDSVRRVFFAFSSARESNPPASKFLRADQTDPGRGFTFRTQLFIRQFLSRLC